MSKESDYKKKIKQSRLIPNAYKKIYNDDCNELKREHEESKQNLNKFIETLPEEKITKLKLIFQKF